MHHYKLQGIITSSRDKQKADATPHIHLQKDAIGYKSRIIFRCVKSAEKEVQVHIQVHKYKNTIYIIIEHIVYFTSYMDKSTTK